ncbi:MAG: hypothetical protein M1816_000078 [Peltula sp. TS41687]|nr:MAG: hypothetical protein M1816_000078 [Peltula sp. TS41687]
MAGQAYRQEQEITLTNLQTITPNDLSILLQKSIGNSPSPNPSTDTKPLTITDTLTTSTTAAAAGESNTSSKPKDLAIIDVRDSDHIGGHIKTSRHVPSATLDARMPELVRELQDVPVVVFHCALSQQRGPKAALRYLREQRRRLVGGQHEDGRDGAAKQKVLVLQGGFQEWQEL